MAPTNWIAPLVQKIGRSQQPNLKVREEKFPKVKSYVRFQGDLAYAYLSYCLEYDCDKCV